MFMVFLASINKIVPVFRFLKKNNNKLIIQK